MLNREMLITFSDSLNFNTDQFTWQIDLKVKHIIFLK